MTGSGSASVLVTGATGRVGRLLIDELLEADVPVRALIHRAGAATLPAGVEAVTGDLAEPASLDPVLRSVSAVFLVWTALPSTAPDVIDRIAANTGRMVFLSAPHRTQHPFFQQPNPMAALYAEIERLIEASDIEGAFIRPGMLASNSLLRRAGAIRGDGVIRWPYGDVETAPIDDGDVAAVAAQTLYQDGYVGGITCSQAPKL